MYSLHPTAVSLHVAWSLLVANHEQRRKAGLMALLMQEHHFQ